MVMKSLLLRKHSKLGMHFSLWCWKKKVTHWGGRYMVEVLDQSKQKGFTLVWSKFDLTRYYYNVSNWGCLLFLWPSGRDKQCSKRHSDRHKGRSIQTTSSLHIAGAPERGRERLHSHQAYYSSSFAPRLVWPQWLTNDSSNAAAAGDRVSISWN